MAILDISDVGEQLVKSHSTAHKWFGIAYIGTSHGIFQVLYLRVAYWCIEHGGILDGQSRICV